jgi:hypothetical protein
MTKKNNNQSSPKSSTKGVEPIGAGIKIKEEHALGIDATKGKAMSDKVRKDYRRRVKHIIEWILVDYPDYAAAGGVSRLRSCGRCCYSNARADRR